ncbi:ABC transporter ATP-binding protein [Halomicrobium salinisoli]|uniref:ABC transporter ATP-binding protein n=1 Tax=Halomicrobium salinisoli TaxID=2878391 RepID=UPI001CF0A1FB|nr:ABC transporter ATP-binding protein [Halomicrobium salinisoli]
MSERSGRPLAGMSPLGFLWRSFVRPRAAKFALGVGLMLGARIPQRVPALLIGIAVDALLLRQTRFAIPLIPQSWVPASTTGHLLLVLGVMGAALLAETGMDWFGQLAYERVTLETLHDVRTRVYELTTSLPTSYYDDAKGGDVMSVLNNDVDNLKGLFDGTRDGILYGGQIASAFAFMFFLHAELAVLLLVIPAVLLPTSRKYGSLVNARYENVRESVGEVNIRLRDAIAGIGTVKAFGNERVEAERVERASETYKSTNWSTIKLRILYNGTVYSIASVGSWGLFLLGGYWIIEGAPWLFTHSLSPGTLLTFLIYAQSFLQPTRQLAVEVIDSIQNARASCNRIVNLVTQADDTRDRYTTTDEAVAVSDIAYRDVSFGYENSDEYALEDVDFEVAPGDFVGVVGASGAGKSTLVKLLFRFYEPDEGSILVGGRDVESVDVETLRSQIGYVSQDPFLFASTVEENIAYARPQVSRSAVVEAAKTAGAHEFITSLPDGYDSQVGQRGSSLSGGQRQRIAIARALVDDPPVIVFDEATSHVDNDTEAEIQRSLSATAGDRTVISIAHRLSTVRDADRILVLDDGRIVETGSHEELLDAGGTYADLWRVQVGQVAAETDDNVDVFGGDAPV